MHPVYTQAIYYGIVMLICFLGVGVILRGFFWKYIKVRLSFGKYVMVKVRTVLRDYYAVGWVKDGFLIYKLKGKELRYSLEGSMVFYRSIAVTWIDVDEEKGAVSKTDYTPVSGFDVEKFSNLYVRALTSPQVTTNKEKIIIALLVVIVLGVVAAIYISFMGYNQSMMTARNLPGMINSIKSSVGTVVGGTSNI